MRSWTTARSDSTPWETFYILPTGHILHEPLYIQIVHRDLTSAVQRSRLIPRIVEELEFGLEWYWGKDMTEWKEVRLWDTVMKLVRTLPIGFSSVTRCAEMRATSSM